jgi:hypothetical protein
MLKWWKAGKRMGEWGGEVVELEELKVNRRMTGISTFSARPEMVDTGSKLFFCWGVGGGGGGGGESQ